MRSASRAFMRHKPIRFVLMGALNTSASFALFALFVSTGLSVALASLLALLAGIGISFTTQGGVVFRNATRHTFARYVAAWAAIYFINLGIIEVLMGLKASAYLAGALATIPVAAVSYVVLNRFVFGRSVAGTAGRTS